jgi:hypothetical protein
MSVLNFVINVFFHKFTQGNKVVLGSAISFGVDYNAVENIVLITSEL